MWCCQPPVTHKACSFLNLLSINLWMRTRIKTWNFKAFLTCKVLSFQCSVSESGNIGSHKSQRGCRSNFHLLSVAFPITLPTVQLSRPRPFFLLSLGGKTFLHVKCFAICQNNNFIFFFPQCLSHNHLFCCQTALLFNDPWGYFSLKKEENS